MAEEWLLGRTFKRDGSDYDPSAPAPRWADVLDRIEEELMQTLEMVVLGIFYPGGKPSGVSGVFTWNSVLNAALERESHGAEEDMVPVIDNAIVFHAPDLVDRGNTPFFVQELFGLERAPEHVFGIVLRKVN